MANKNLKFLGDKELQKHIKKMSDPEKAFDKDFRSAAIQLDRELKINTPKDMGTTAKAWVTKKKGMSYYTIENKTTTQDGKYSLVDILEEGHKEIVPVKASKLYIPLTRRAQAKKLGAPIPKSFVYGVDYVFAKKVAATKGKKFVEKAMKRAGSELEKRIKRTIDKS